MKTIAFLLLLAAPVLAHAADIHPGESLADVQAALGIPNGHVQIDNKLTLLYDRGQIEFVDGKVVSMDLLSPKEFDAKQARENASAAQIAQLRTQRIAEGQDLKAQKLTDPAFTSTPPAYQLSYWQNFRLLYPEVPCDSEYQFALARQQDQIAKQEHESELALARQREELVRQQEQFAAQEREQKLAELEARVTEAEKRATLAENAASQAQYNVPVPSPCFIVVVSRERFREREDEDHDRDDRGPRNNTPSPHSIPKNQISLPTFPIPTVPSLNLPTPKTTPNH
jgi:hypothetical protein